MGKYQLKSRKEGSVITLLRRNADRCQSCLSMGEIQYESETDDDKDAA